MIKLFRNIRQNLLNEGKNSKYLKYAIGEIVLVVIGILFALQINAWNSARITQKNIQNYYGRIHLELNDELIHLARDLNNFEGLAEKNLKTLEILNSQNRDSIPVLQQTLGALGTAWTVNLEFPIVEEFLNHDYLSKIENDSIKTGLKNLMSMLVIIDVANEHTISQYANTIEPFFNTHINYSEVALSNYDGLMIKGGPLTNYEALFDNLEIWNIASFKLETLSLDIKDVKGYIEELEWLDKQLLKELENQNDH